VLGIDDPCIAISQRNIGELPSKYKPIFPSRLNIYFFACVFHEFTYIQTPYAYLALVGELILVIEGGWDIRFAVGTSVLEFTVKYLNKT
jgi:hypothetical protein